MSSEKASRYLQAFGEHLSDVGGHFQKIESCDSNAILQFPVPTQISAKKEVVEASSLDAALLAGAMYAGAAFLELQAQYKIAEGQVLDFWESYCYGPNETDSECGDPSERRVDAKAFVAMQLSEDLGAFRPGFNLSLVRDRLTKGLQSFESGAGNMKGEFGFMQVRDARAKVCADEWTYTFRTLRESLESKDVIKLSEDRRFELHLSKFFDSPLDRTQLDLVLGVQPWIVANVDPRTGIPTYGWGSEVENRLAKLAEPYVKVPVGPDDTTQRRGFLIAYDEFFNRYCAPLNDDNSSEVSMKTGSSQ